MLITGIAIPRICVQNQEYWHFFLIPPKTIAVDETVTKYKWRSNRVSWNGRETCFNTSRENNVFLFDEGNMLKFREFMTCPFMDVIDIPYLDPFQHEFESSRVSTLWAMYQVRVSNCPRSSSEKAWRTYTMSSQNEVQTAISSGLSGLRFKNLKYFGPSTFCRSLRNACKKEWNIEYHNKMARPFCNVLFVNTSGGIKVLEKFKVYINDLNAMKGVDFYPLYGLVSGRSTK